MDLHDLVTAFTSCIKAQESAILLAGGNKDTQEKDIAKAQELARSL